MLAQLRRIVVTLVVASALLSPPAQAETLTETIVAEQRISLSLSVATEAVQAFLPAGWAVNPAVNANLNITFMDVALVLGPDGQPLQAGVNRKMVVSVPAKNRTTGEARSMIVGGYSADPLGVPGPYKVYAAGGLDVSRSERSDGGLGISVEENWTAKGADGAVVMLSVSFSRGVPKFASLDQKNYSAADPDFYRTYRIAQASDIVRNRALGVDRVRSVTLKASGGKLGAAVDGSQTIVAITSSPFYSRQTFVR